MGLINNQGSHNEVQKHNAFFTVSLHLIVTKGIANKPYRSDAELGLPLQPAN